MNKLKSFIALRMLPNQKASQYCSVIEERFLRPVRLGEFKVTDIDRVCTTKLMSSLHANESYRELATVIQLQLDGIGLAAGTVTEITWKIAKQIVHKRDVGTS